MILPKKDSIACRLDWFHSFSSIDFVSKEEITIFFPRMENVPAWNSLETTQLVECIQIEMKNRCNSKVIFGMNHVINTHSNTCICDKIWGWRTLPCVPSLAGRGVTVLCGVLNCGVLRESMQKHCAKQWKTTPHFYATIIIVINFWFRNTTAGIVVRCIAIQWRY